MSVCAYPIEGLYHHCWGEGTPLLWDYDPATVDRHWGESNDPAMAHCSTCHRSQTIRGGEVVYMRDGGEVVAR